MNRFTRKGFRTLMGEKPDGGFAPFPVAVGSPLDVKNERLIKKMKKDRQKAFREYKAKLRAAKKKVPLEERANINWSRMPERYL